MLPSSGQVRHVTALTGRVSADMMLWMAPTRNQNSGSTGGIKPGHEATNLVPEKVVHRRLHRIALLLARAYAVHCEPERHQGLERHHSFIILHVVPDDE